MSLNPIKGTLKPLKDHVLIVNMSFEEQRTKSGIIIQSDDGKSEGIKPRWGLVWAVGPEQDYFKVGDWILVEHGRWTRGFDLENEDGTTTTVRRVDTKGIILTADNPPEDVTFGLAPVQHGSTFDASDFANPMYEGQRG